MANMRRKLTAEHASQIILDWHEKSYQDFAAEFGVSVNTIRSMVADIRKEDDSRCPKKPRKNNRRDIVKQALQLVKAKEEDVLTDA